jgi:hypothetical protein
LAAALQVLLVIDLWRNTEAPCPDYDSGMQFSVPRNHGGDAICAFVTDT